jgi:hypothetical protein
VKIDYKSELGYLNMKEVLKDYPQLTDFAIEASKRAGVHARASSDPRRYRRFTSDGTRTSDAESFHRRT